MDWILILRSLSTSIDLSTPPTDKEIDLNIDADLNIGINIDIYRYIHKSIHPKIVFIDYMPLFLITIFRSVFIMKLV